MCIIIQFKSNEKYAALNTHTIWIPDSVKFYFVCDAYSTVE